ncbi:MAG: PhoX family protein [Vibrio sp.]
MSKDTFNPKRFNPTNNTEFSEVVDRHLSRRNFVKGGFSLTALAAFGGFGLVGCSSDSNSSSSSNSGLTNQSNVTLGFDSIAGSKTDAVAIPANYRAQVLAPWGTPLNSQANPWKDDGTNTPTDQLNSVGQHHDGMHFFPLNEEGDDGLLCINHEYIDQDALHPNGASVDDSGKRYLVDEIRKEIYAHGVSVVRIKRDANGLWQVVENDSYNKRYTSDTPMTLAGPVAMTDHVITPYSKDGSTARGTSNNCGNGTTPWGTYMTCEENWPGYFVDLGEMSEANQRIGISDSGTRYGWDHLAGHADEIDDEFARFNITATGANATQDYRNEANGHGYLVEIDPYNPDAMAVKRTAMGRIRHENCTFGQLVEGQPVVFYTGHDSRFEYLYKYVSNAPWDPADALDSTSNEDRLAIGDKYLNDGTLYVAKFNEDGQGQWLALSLDGVTQDGSTLAQHFESQADIIINTAGAADLVGATPMDRPEWCTVDPNTGSVYLTLTNNSQRTETNPANPRPENNFGHIIRWDESDNQVDFTWDIFLFGSASSADEATNISQLTDLNELASPDGLAFDPRGILWIQTDNGAPEVTEKTNDQMLAIVPSALVDDNGEPQVVNAQNQSALKRFFVGPNGCEVTGFAISPDYKDVFANIQHPANWPYSDDATEVTPEGVTVRPRAATVVISKVDGGEVGV